MLDALAYVLSFIVQPCYELTGNWWLAILLFTVIIKIVLMPLALWCQWNSIVMVKIMPDLNRIKVKYFGDSETIGEKQTELNKKHHYHPLLSLVPLAVQILILFGLVEVIHGITDNGAPGTEFLGMVPIEDGGLSWIMPLLAGLSAVALGFAQNRINPLQREQSRMEKNTTNGLSIALSLILGIYVAAGMAFYWICSNLMAIVVQALCNLIIRPAKYIDYEDLAESRVELDELNALTKRKTPWYKRDPLAKREKEDYRRFMGVVDKHLVFYSEGSGFYKYFQGAIEWLLEHSNVIIHYVTSDPDDQVFMLHEKQPRLMPYFIREKRLITLMMKMDSDMVVTTLGDLDVYYIKRSYIRKDIEYVYMFHHMTSTGPTSHKEEYMNYDTLLCVGPEQIEEQKRFEEIYASEGVRKKNLVPTGYDLLDREIADYEKKRMDAAKKERPIVLIGPSWHPGNICDSCIDELIESLLGHGWRIIVRPHPEYTKRYRPRWDAILERWKHVSEDELYFERDFSSNSTITDSDVLITDWSSVAFEFSFSTKKPSVFINTEPKVNNPNYEEFAPNPSDVWLRDAIGLSFDLDKLDGVSAGVEDMIANPERWSEKITTITEEMVFNLGHGGEAAGRYILDRLLEMDSSRSCSSIDSGEEEQAARSEQSSTPAELAAGDEDD